MERSSTAIVMLSWRSVAESRWEHHARRGGAEGAHGRAGLRGGVAVLDG